MGTFVRIDTNAGGWGTKDRTGVVEAMVAVERSPVTETSVARIFP